MDKGILKQDRLSDVIQLVSQVQQEYRALQEDNEYLMTELEKAWEENEALKVRIAEVKKYEEQLDILKKIAAKIESVTA